MQIRNSIFGGATLSIIFLNYLRYDTRVLIGIGSHMAQRRQSLYLSTCLHCAPTHSSALNRNTMYMYDEFNFRSNSNRNVMERIHFSINKLLILLRMGHKHPDPPT